jgi:hypothetical protein
VASSSDLDVLNLLCRARSLDASVPNLLALGFISATAIGMSSGDGRVRGPPNDNDNQRNAFTANIPSQDAGVAVSQLLCRSSGRALLRYNVAVILDTAMARKL